MKHNNIHRFHSNHSYIANTVCIHVVEERERKRSIADAKTTPSQVRELARERDWELKIRS